VIDNPVSCEIRAVIHFLHAKNMSAAEIHRALCVIYGQNVMSEGAVRQWCGMFKDGRRNIHHEEPSGRLSVVSDDLVQTVDQKNCEKWRFTISEFLCEFPQISCTVLYRIIMVRLGYHMFCAKRVPKMLMDAHKMQRMASTFVDLFRAIPQRW
jgi:hypothetical protein